VGLSVLKLFYPDRAMHTGGTSSRRMAQPSPFGDPLFYVRKTQGPANPEALRVPPAKDSKLVAGAAPTLNPHQS